MPRICLIEFTYGAERIISYIEKCVRFPQVKLTEMWMMKSSCKKKQNMNEKNEKIKVKNE